MKKHHDVAVIWSVGDAFGDASSNDEDEMISRAVNDADCYGANKNGMVTINNEDFVNSYRRESPGSTFTRPGRSPLPILTRCDCLLLFSPSSFVSILPLEPNPFACCLSVLVQISLFPIS